ncbi:MAG TPA: hypothetical protein VKU83_01800, partial [Puia sp.]|nr:hypothetical protein [Puia sp.]
REEEMKNKLYGRAFLPILVVFLVFTGAILFGAPVLKGWNTDGKVLLVANELLFALTAVSYLLHLKSLRNQNPHFFVRMVYGSLVVKMLACLLAVFLYGVFASPVNKGAIFGSFILYVIYTFLEVKTLIKFLKKPGHA